MARKGLPSPCAPAVVCVWERFGFPLTPAVRCGRARRRCAAGAAACPFPAAPGTVSADRAEPGGTPAVNSRVTLLSELLPYSR